MPIHPTAIISKDAQLAADVTVGPFSIIEGPVKIGAGTVIHAHAVLRGPMTLGLRNVVHSHAVLGDWPQDRKYKLEHSETIIGDENIFREGVTIHRGTGANTRTSIGSRCYFMVNSHVGHNSKIDDDVTLINGAVIAGHCHVASRAIIGAYSAIHQFTRIGRLAMMSNGSMTTVDIPPFFTSMATNTITQLNAVGLRRSGMPRESINAIRKMFQIAFRNNTGFLSDALANLPADIASVPEVQEFVQFCKTTKRGIARFQAWSNRTAAESSDVIEE